VTKEPVCSVGRSDSKDVNPLPDNSEPAKPDLNMQAGNAVPIAGEPDFARTPQVNGDHFVSGNSIAILANGAEAFPAMIAAIDASEESVDLEFFIISSDEVGTQFVHALSEAAARNIDVRVMVDPFGSRNLSNYDVKQMAHSGVHFTFSRPPSGARFWRHLVTNHRKILLCDGSLGFTGGLNIDRRWAGKGNRVGNWRDYAVLLRGPCLADFLSAFELDWSTATGERFQPRLIADGTFGSSRVEAAYSHEGGLWSAVGEQIYRLISSASRSIRIQSAYFAPDRAMERALFEAQNRGVKVEVMLSGRHANNPLMRRVTSTFIPRLLAHGITLHWYDLTMLHSKLILVDADTSVVGSANFDARSMGYSAEFQLCVADADFAEVLASVWKRDLRECRTMNSISPAITPSFALRAPVEMLRQHW
jgi:cardiolipin synthase